MERVFLNEKSVAVKDVAVLHSNENRHYGNVIRYGKGEGSVLHRTRLAVIPPHSLLGINKYRFTSAEKRRARPHEFFHS